MAKKDMLKELEAAISKQADSLDPAQRAFVMHEFETYKWNAAKIEELQSKVSGSDPLDMDELKAEGAIMRERHQLITEQAQLFSHIMRWLKGTTADEPGGIEKFAFGN